MTDKHLAMVQRRREFLTRITQRIQAVLQKQTFGTGKMPLPMRVMEPTTLPCRMQTRFVGLGIGPKQLKTPDVWDTRANALLSGR